MNDDLPINQFSNNDVEIVEDIEAYSGFYKIHKLTFRHRLFRGSWSEPLQRELFIRHDAVGVLLFDPRTEQVALVEQVRAGVIKNDMATQSNTSPWLLEPVAGLIDKVEIPEQVARREALEEAGVVVARLKLIADYYASPGGSNEFFHLYVGEVNLSDAGGVFGLEEEGEDIKVHVLSLPQCWDLLAAGKLNNAHTLIAVQWLRLNCTQLQQEWT